MKRWQDKGNAFLEAFKIVKGDVVCLTGAGGKSSLMFHLAEKGRRLGWKVLVTTTTRIRIPAPERYDLLDLSGESPHHGIVKAGVVVGGVKADEPDKIAPYPSPLSRGDRAEFDLILIEADGAARKPLKGWNPYEPVIPEYCSLTIGVVDISTIGLTIDTRNIHRLARFLEITGAETGAPVTLSNLRDLILSDNGIFRNSRKRRAIYMNKMEYSANFTDGAELRQALPATPCFGGSVLKDAIYE